MTTRRGFLGSILALGAAPAIVRADSLMRIVPRETRVLTFLSSPSETLTHGQVAYLHGMFYYSQPSGLLVSHDNISWSLAEQ